MTISIAALIAVAKQAASGASEAQTLFQKLRAARLSAEEKELLAAAAVDGEFMLLDAEQLPAPLI